MSWEDCMPMQIIFYNFLKANFPKPFVMNENTFTLFSEPESDLVNYISLMQYLQLASFEMYCSNFQNLTENYAYKHCKKKPF